MKFKNRNLRAIAEIIIGDGKFFPYRSSSYITQFFEECDLNFVHDGSTRWAWTAARLFYSRDNIGISLLSLNNPNKRLVL